MNEPRPIPKRGRPASLPGHESPTKPRSVRLDDARWKKLQALGRGWLEQAIDKARASSVTQA